MSDVPAAIRVDDAPHRERRHRRHRHRRRHAKTREGASVMSVLPTKLPITRSGSTLDGNEISVTVASFDDLLNRPGSHEGVSEPSVVHRPKVHLGSDPDGLSTEDITGKGTNDAESVTDEPAEDRFALRFPTFRFRDPVHEAGFVQMYYGDNMCFQTIVAGFLTVVNTILPFYVVFVEGVFKKEDTLTAGIVIGIRGIQGLLSVFLGIVAVITSIFFGCKTGRSRKAMVELERLGGGGPDSEPLVLWEWTKVFPWMPNAIDCFWMAVGACMLLIQGVLAGYVYPHRSEGLLMLVALLGFRLRVVPSILVQGLCILVGHFVAMICLLAMGHNNERGVPAESGVVPVSMAGVLLPFFESVLFFVALVFVGGQFEYSTRLLYKHNVRMHELCEVLRKENDRQESLVGNVYPVELLPVLRRDGRYGKHFECLGILVNDIARFTQLSVRIESRLLFWFLNELYSAFDAIALKHQLTKVKTVGDSWVGIMFHSDDNEAPMTDSFWVIIAACEMNTAFGEIWSAAREAHEAFQPGEIGEQACALRTGVSIGEGWVYVIGAKAKSKSRLTFDVVGPCHTQASHLEASGIENKVLCCEAIRKHAPNASGLSFEETTTEFHGEEIEAYIVSFDETLLTPSPASVSPSEMSDSSFPSSASSGGGRRHSTTCSMTLSGHGSGTLSELGRDPKICSKGWWTLYCLCRKTAKDTLRIGYDQFSLQTTFLSICFSNAILVSIFVAAEIFLLVDLDPMFHASVVGLSCIIIFSSCLGILFVQTRVRIASVALVCLVFVMTSALATVLCLYAFVNLHASSIPIRRIANTGFITVLFAANAFPTIPFLVKLFPAILCFVLSLLVFWGSEMGAAEGFWFDFFLDFWVGVCISLFGIYYCHYILLKGFERGEAVRRTSDIVRRNLAENERLLSSALPPVIVTMLQNGEMHHKGGESFKGGCLFGIVVAPESADLIPVLDIIFSEFDELISTFPEIQRIKCFGRRILCVTGMNQSPVSVDVDHQGVLYGVAKAMITRVAELRASSTLHFENVHIRIGVHLGSFAGGICGTSKWLFDVVGLSINTTCRLAENAGLDEILCLKEFVDGWNCRDGSAHVCRRGMRELKGIEGKQETFSIHVDAESAEETS